MSDASLSLPGWCAYAFDVIANTFDSNVALQAPPVNTTDKFPMFVTWKKREADEKNWRLRGCIGTFSPQPLAEGIKKYAHTSAFKDSRFKPLAAAEVPRLCCHVSLLTNFEPAKDCYDWKVGTHGIQIDFTEKSESYSATYLPEVALEQGWSQAEAIKELVAKSGFEGSVTAALRAKIKLTRYQSKHAVLTYAEYLALRSSSGAGSAAAAAATNGASTNGHGATNGNGNGHAMNGNGNGNGSSNGHGMNGNGNGNSSANGNGAAKGKAKGK